LKGIEVKLLEKTGQNTRAWQLTVEFVLLRNIPIAGWYSKKG
jgi:hypothetical protein